MRTYKLIRATLAIALLAALVFGADAFAHDTDVSASTTHTGESRP